MKTIGKKEIVNVESEKPKIVAVEEAESHKTVVAPKERNINLQLHLEKTDRDSGGARNLFLGGPYINFFVCV